MSRQPLSYRHPDVAPCHGVPFGQRHEPLEAEQVGSKSNVAKVCHPQSPEIIAHHLDLGRGVQHGYTNHEQEAIGVTELQGNQASIIIVLEPGTAPDLLLDEPVRGYEGGHTARDAIGRGQLDAGTTLAAPRQ